MDYRRIAMTVMLLALAHAAYGQDSTVTHEPARWPIAALELGGGYIFGGGAENPGPSVASYDLGGVFWLTSRWGGAVRVVHGPGQDFHEPISSGDRTFFGPENVRYTIVTVRYRWPVRPRTFLEIGGGLMVRGRFTDQEQLHATGQVLHAASDFGGLSIEALVSRHFTRALGVKAGITYDFNPETTNLQPVVLGTIGF
jgi:hypothetical protein